MSRTHGQAKRALLRSLRESQLKARQGDYATAFSYLERALAEHLGVTCCHCGRAQTSTDGLCDGCRRVIENQRARRAEG